MTVQEITKKLNTRKPCSVVQVRRYLRRLKIKPVGEFRTKPQHYPEDAADVILGKLGLSIVSLNQLRAVRSKAQKARAA